MSHPRLPTSAPPVAGIDVTAFTSDIIRTPCSRTRPTHSFWPLPGRSRGRWGWPAALDPVVTDPVVQVRAAARAEGLWSGQQHAEATGSPGADRTHPGAGKTSSSTLRPDLKQREAPCHEQAADVGRPSSAPAAGTAASATFSPEHTTKHRYPVLHLRRPRYSS